jgi:hypothetical protein
MFVEAHLTLPLPLSTALAALDRAMADGGLVAQSQKAYDEGIGYLMRVGPRSGRGIRKQVFVKLLPSRLVNGTTVVPLRWEATGAAGRMFPSLDANLGITAAGDNSSIISMLGRYEPPLGAMGTAIDRTLLSGTAQATAEALLREVADKLGELAADRAGVAG